MVHRIIGSGVSSRRWNVSDCFARATRPDLHRAIPSTRRRRLRRGATRPQRTRGQAARADRVLPRHGGRGRLREAGARAEPRGRRARRRPQRRREGSHRRRPDDRPRADEGHPCRSRRSNGARAGRRVVERAEPRDAAARTRDHRRRRGEHGHRRPDAWRRHRLADAEVRARARQPAIGRDGDGRRQRVPRERRREPRSLLGNSRRRWQLRHRRVAGIRPASGGTDHHRWSCRASDPEGARGAAVLPGDVRLRAGRAHAGRRAADRARRIRREAGRDYPGALRFTGGRREDRGADQGVRPACHGHDRTDSLQHPEHASRCLLSERRAQLLEGVLPHRPERRCDCGAAGVLLGLPLSDEPDRDRALPRKGEPGRHHRHGVRDARSRDSTWC